MDMLTIAKPGVYSVLPDITCQNKPVPFWQAERRGLLVNILVFVARQRRHRAILRVERPGEAFYHKRRRRHVNRSPMPT